MDVRIRLVVRIIEEHAGAMHLSSEQMASLLGLSKERLLRLFHAEVGKSFRRHLLEVRMRVASEMLADCRLPIKTIASRFGYTAVSNFHRDFKIVHGRSPARVRIMLMEIPGSSTTSVPRVARNYAPLTGAQDHRQSERVVS